MSKRPEPGRVRSARLLAVGLALVLVVAGFAVGHGDPVAAETPATGGNELDASRSASFVGGNENESLVGGNEDVDAQEDVDIEIDCEANEVRVTAPASFGYALRVSNVLVTPERSEVLTTTTTESGDATVALTESGPVYVFVSDGTGLVGSAFENCALSQKTQTPNTTTEVEPGPASVEIDCNASEVRVTAAADFAYTLRVSNIIATPQSTDVFTTTQTASGNATVSIGDPGAVSVFVSDETGTVASAFDNCEFDENER